MTISEDQRLEMAAGRIALRVTISDVKDHDPVKLLEDSTKFLRDVIRDHPDYIAKGEGDELMFRRDDGEFVIVAVKY